MKPFIDVVEFTLHHEGGYVNDPDDPGRETKYGISKRSYPHLDIKSLTRDDAKVIYHRDYWLAMRCNEMPLRVGASLFDTGVNLGTRRAVRFLQRQIGASRDGIVGPETLGLIEPHHASRLLTRRLSWYTKLMRRRPVMRKYERGWFRRVVELSTYVGGLECELQL